jgi:hypothetical protein
MGGRGGDDLPEGRPGKRQCRGHPEFGSRWQEKNCLLQFPYIFLSGLFYNDMFLILRLESELDFKKYEKIINS